MLGHLHEPTVGGREFDEKLIAHFAAEFKRKTKLDVKESERAVAKLRWAHGCGLRRCDTLARYLGARRPCIGIWLAIAAWPWSRRSGRCRSP